MYNIVYYIYYNSFPLHKDVHYSYAYDEEQKF